MSAAKDVTQEDSRESRLYAALCVEYPYAVDADDLTMQICGDADNFASAFISLCIAFCRLNQVLSGTGWQAFRTGGTPEDTYWLSPIGDG